MESLQDAIASDHGIRVTDHKMVIYGTCTTEPCPRRGSRRARRPGSMMGVRRA
jgi:hypothetical protein